MLAKAIVGCGIDIRVAYIASPSPSGMGTILHGEQNLVGRLKRIHSEAAVWAAQETVVERLRLSGWLQRASRALAGLADDLMRAELREPTAAL